MLILASVFSRELIAAETNLTALGHYKRLKETVKGVPHPLSKNKEINICRAKVQKPLSILEAEELN